MTGRQGALSPIQLLRLVGAVVVLALAHAARSVPELDGLRSPAAFAGLVAFLSKRPGKILAAVAPVVASHPPFGMGVWLAPWMYALLFLSLRRANGSAEAARLGAWIGLAEGYVLADWSTRGLWSPEAADLLLGGIAAIYWAGAAVLARAGMRLGSWPGILLAAAAIPLAEHARCEGWGTGLRLSYLLTAHAAAGSTGLAQWAEPLGVTGLSGLCCLMSLFAAAAGDAVCRDRRRGIKMIVVTLIGFLAITLAGEARRRVVVANPTVSKQLIIVQDTIDHDSRRTELRRRLAEALAGPPAEAVILPESSLYRLQVPGGSAIVEAWDPDELAGMLAAPDAATRVAVAGMNVGIAASDGRDLFRNVITVVEAGRGVTTLRDKKIPAPVGEWAPWAGVPLLGPWMRGLAGGGTSQHVALDPRAELTLPSGLRLAVAVCYEHTFPEIWREKGLDRAERFDLQLALANLGGLDFDPTERGQSRAARKLAAIVHRRPFLLVAAGGSEWIDTTGRLRGALASHEASACWRIDVPTTSDEPTSAALSSIRRRFGSCFLVVLLLGLATRTVGSIHGGIRKRDGFVGQF